MRRFVGSVYSFAEGKLAIGVGATRERGHFFAIVASLPWLRVLLHDFNLSIDDC